MDLDTIKATLRQLHQEIETGGKLDPELVSLLQTLEEDLHKARPAEDSLTERAQSISARFSADHPYLASTLRDLADALGKMGI